jgi:hypothetical protein
LHVRWKYLGLPLFLSLFSFSLEAQQGYTIQDNQIVIDTQGHWQAWAINTGISVITAEGSVSPRFLRKQVNAALDAETFAVQFQGGAVAGTNQEEAHHLTDGDMSTSWGPDLDRPPEDWWVQIQLGRVVVVEKIVLRFVEEDKGEPFLQFNVLGWRHPPPLSSSKYVLLGTNISRFWSLFRTDRPIKSQRVFEIVPKTTERANEEFVGDPLEVVHILLTDSSLDRMREVGRQTYEALPQKLKGAVDYYRRVGGNRQTLTTRENYETLSPANQGRILYFRRERPRLAEVEVWTIGDNLNLDRVMRGGQTTIQTNVDPQNPTSAGVQDLATTVTDGNFTTGPSFSIFRNRLNTLFEDLGTLFWVDTLHFLTDTTGGYISELSVEVSDGTRAPDGSIKWTEMGEQKTSALYRLFTIEPSKIRFLRTRFGSSSFRQVSFLEVMLYGEGYVAEVALNSGLIDLGLHKSLVSIEWEADTPPGTQVEITTRTGNTLDEQKIYHDSDGRVVSEDRYTRRLPRSKKGEITSLFIPDRSWSPWSRPYEFSGQEIRSPRNRKHLQIQVRVLADTTSKYGQPAELHAIRVNLTDFYVDQLTGEVWPHRVEKIGQPEERSYFIQPLFSNDEQGFDEFRIAATAATTMELVEVRTGSQEDFRQASFQRFTAAQIDIIQTGTDTLIFRLPAPIRQGVELVEVRFQPTIYAHSTAFEAVVKAAGNAGWQQVDVGNATNQVSSQTNVVVALADNAVLTDLQIEAPIFSPNGDGINDVMTFHFSINRLHAEKVVQLSIYDLSGRRVQQLRQVRIDPRGRYALIWSGEDLSGRKVPPGLYLSRIEVDAESSRAEQTSLSRLVHVVY